MNNTVKKPPNKKKVKRKNPNSVKNYRSNNSQTRNRTVRRKKSKRRLSARKKRKLIRLCTLFFIISLEIIVLIRVIIKNNKTSEPALNNITETAEPQTQKIKKELLEDYIIFIDPGHGFSDGGTESPKEIGNIIESEVTLDIAFKIEKLLKAEKANVVMSRTTNYNPLQEDEFVKLRTEDRVNLAEKANADIFISLHVDSLENHPEVNGYTIYYYDNEVKKNKNTPKLAKNIKNEFVKAVAITNDNIKVANMEQSTAYDVVNYTTMPSILFELGYSTSKQDSKNLASEAWKQKAALGITNGIKKYFEEISEAQNQPTETTASQQ